jgi:hypothetical protein
MHNVSIEVVDGTPAGQIALFYVNITSVNDAPIFNNLNNISINKSYFELILSANDEEANLSLVFNASFLSCGQTASNPVVGNGNCSIFNLTSYNSRKFWNYSASFVR